MINLQISWLLFKRFLIVSVCCSCFLAIRYISYKLRRVKQFVLKIITTNPVFPGTWRIMYWYMTAISRKCLHINGYNVITLHGYRIVMRIFEVILWYQWLMFDIIIFPFTKWGWYASLYVAIYTYTLFGSCFLYSHLLKTRNCT